MLKVTTKDKIFVQVALPIALLAAFVWFLRNPAVAERNRLAEEYARLPDPAVFPQLEKVLERRVSEAETSLAAARAEEIPASSVKGDPSTGSSERQCMVLDLFKKAGTSILAVEPDVRELGRGGETLRSTGMRPSPEAWKFRVEAGYSAVLFALREMSNAKMPVVPVSVKMDVVDVGCKWEVALWL